MKQFRIEHDGQWYTAQAVSAVYVVSLLRVAVARGDVDREVAVTRVLSLIHISEPTRPCGTSRMPSSA